MGDIDDVLAVVVYTPFHAWLRIIGISTNVLTLPLEDVGFVKVGDTLGFYDNDTTVLRRGASTVVVTGISGTDVTVDDASALSVDDEIAVVWTYEYDGRTFTQIGPPREIQSKAVHIARYYAMGDIASLDEPADTIQDVYDKAIEWLEERGKGHGLIRGASYKGYAWSNTMGEQPAIDIDDPNEWDHDEDALDRVENDRI
jgi:hypothetical protein